VKASSDHDTATLSHIIDITALHAHEAEFIVEADETQRMAVAERLRIPGIRKLRGVFRVRPVRGGAEIKLRLEAETERQCVVSLEPMTEAIDDDIVMTFDRNFVESEEDETAWREPLDGDEIDLGELLVQHLSLALDPYPRKDGAESLLETYRNAATASPFAGLKGLKDPDS